MSREETQIIANDAVLSGSSESQRATILAVGSSDEWMRLGHQLPSEDGVKFASIEQINGDFLAEIDPSVVLSPALAIGFDCIDLAQLLFAIKYRGRYRAITSELPNPKMVENEIRQLCPGLDFAILTNN